jgi:serine/threonine-protein kinase
MRTLNHPAIQKGLDSGSYNNTPYLVTELIDGASLRDLIGKSDPLKIDDSIAIIRKIAEGLNHCHENGIIHRDLKPENILITFEGQPIILDFGLALTKNAHRVTYANLSGAAGTPDYMAPEQIEGHRGDNRTDIYALGIIFFELLKGETPFHGDNNLAVMAQHLKGGIRRLDKEVEGISPQIAAIVAKCLQRNPNDRYQNLKEFIDDLDNPEKVDITILNKATGRARGISWWRSPIIVSAGTALLMLIIIIILGLILQHFHK